jgi:hypothetical protein
MPREFIDGYLRAAADTYDRAAYAVFKPEIQTSLTNWN